MALVRFSGFVAMVPTNKRNWLLVGLWLLSVSASGQTTVSKYLVLLKDKVNSPYSVSSPSAFLSARAISRRSKQNIAVTTRDLPPNPTYISQIRQTGATVWYSSRWLNAVLVLADDATIQKVKSLSFVSGLELGRSLAGISPSPTPSTVQSAGQIRATEALPNYGNSQGQVAQIGVDKMHDKGYHGEGMLLAVLDDGFLNANTVSYLSNLFSEQRVIGTYDFVQRETKLYENGGHGTSVLSTMAGTLDNQLYGTAYKANFLLLRTEDDATEKPIEEANWLFGAEYADSTGADIITSSLGYNTFDAPFPSHIYTELNGKTTLVTRAAQWASEVGMVVLVAAGNDGGSAWRYIGAPADAPGVLAIGAVDRSGIKASFSSFGPSADGRIKPDLAAWGVSTVIGKPDNTITTGNGTSYATPLVAGLAAGLWQVYPKLTAVQVVDILRRSGSQYATPDNSLGYGIPTFDRASQIVAATIVLATTEPLAELLVSPNPFTDKIQLTGLPTNTPVEMMLTDLSGRLVLHQTISGKDAVVLSTGIPSAVVGLYLLHIQTDTAQKMVKLLKE